MDSISAIRGRNALSLGSIVAGGWIARNAVLCTIVPRRVGHSTTKCTPMKKSVEKTVVMVRYTFGVRTATLLTVPRGGSTFRKSFLDYSLMMRVLSDASGDELCNSIGSYWLRVCSGCWSLPGVAEAEAATGRWLPCLCSPREGSVLPRPVQRARPPVLRPGPGLSVARARPPKSSNDSRQLK